MKRPGTSYNIPDGIVHIIQYAFDGCQLSSVSIPASVQNMEKGIFENCISLQTVTVRWTTPLNIDASIFGGVNLPAAALYVPVGTKARYVADPVWGTFGTIVDTTGIYNPGDTVAVAENKPVGADGKGSMSLSLTIPANSLFSGSFMLTLPKGMKLDLSATHLADSLAAMLSLSITQNADSSWLFTITPLYVRSATEMVYSKIVEIGYTVDKTLANGTYKAVVSDLSFAFDNGTTIEQEEAPVTITVDNTITSIPELIAGTNVYLNNGRLYIQSPVAETVQVYSVGGVLLQNFQKPAGAVNYPVNQPKGAVLIVKGSSGWVKKVVNDL